MNTSDNLTFTELSNHKGLKVVHLNCGSLVNKIDLIRYTVLQESNIDIFCVTESWLKPYHGDELCRVANYNMCRLDRDRKHKSGAYVHGGGIIIYVHSNLSFEFVDNFISTFDIELCSLVITNENMKKILLCVVYRPPSGNLAVFFDKLTSIFEKLNSTERNFNTIMCGDFNIDVSKESLRGVSLIKRFCSNFGYSQLIDCPTRYGFGENSSIIDLFFTDCKYVASSGAIDFNCSDHLPTYVTIKKAKESYSKTSFLGRSYTDYNKEVFQTELLGLNWGRLYGTSDVNEAWEIVYNEILLIVERTCPMKEFRIRRDHPPWFNHEIIELSANRDSLYRLSRQKNNIRNTKLRSEARKLKNLVKHRLANIKNEYFIRQLHLNAKDTKKFWRIMDDLTDRKHTQHVKRIRKSHGSELLSYEKSAEALNEFYVTVAKKLTDKLPHSTCIPNINSKESRLSFDQVVTCSKISDILKEFSPLKSSGCLKISSRLYLDAFEVMSEQLSYIMNLSLRSGIFPSAWKRSIVTPIPKKGDRSFVENTRPITLIHIAGKILEKIVNISIDDYNKQFEIISPCQYGFVKGKSTTNCIMALFNDIYKNLNNNLLTGCLFLDYAKAFDTVNHQTLLNKLERYGFVDISWFDSYLTNRSQCVKIGSHFSSFKINPCGVPQGSVLGPTLFNLYLNDICDLNLNSNILLYADDVVIYFANSDPDIIISTLQEDLIKLYDWSVSNKLSISFPKSKYMILGRKARVRKCSITRELKIGNTKLERLNEFCYLGVTIDDILSFNSSISQMHRKAAYRFRTLVYLRRSMTTYCALTFMKSMILPYYDYGCILLSSCSSVCLSKLQLLQNRMLRCVLNLPRDSSIKLMHKQCGILTVIDRIKYNQIKFIYMNLASNTPLFNYYSHSGLPTRSGDEKNLATLRPEYFLFRKSIFYDGIKMWNSLDPLLKQDMSYPTFKYKLKKHFLENYN